MTHPLTRVCGRVPFVVAHRAGNEVATACVAPKRCRSRWSSWTSTSPTGNGSRSVTSRGSAPSRSCGTDGAWRRGGTQRLTLQELLPGIGTRHPAHARPQGRPSPAVGTLVAAVLEGGARPAPHVTVCSRWWRQLDPAARLPWCSASCIRSGSCCQLAATSRGASCDAPHGRCLGAPSGSSTPRPWRGCASVPTMILSWPVLTEDEARLLGGWGVDGVINRSDSRSSAPRSGPR